MAKVFLFFFSTSLFVLDVVRVQICIDLYRFVKLLYELELAWMGYCGYCIPSCTCYPCLNNLFDRLFLAKHCRCFWGGTNRADGAADLLEALSQLPLLEELDLRYCSQIAAAAWQKVRSAKWLHLKRQISVSASQREMVEGWCWRFLVFYAYLFFSVGSCSSSDLQRLWSEVVVRVQVDLQWPVCMGLRLIIYLHLSLSQHPFNRLFLTKHCRCFYTDTKGADGAADLLQALSQSTQLEELDLSGCSQIPAGAWQKLPDGAWPKLQRAYGIAEEELQRLQLGAEGATRRTPSTSTFEIAADDSVALAGPRRLKSAVARYLDADAMELMALLSSSPIEVLDLRYCPRIPAAAWQNLHGAKWLHLKTANFRQCLAERNGWRIMLKVFFFFTRTCIYLSLLFVVPVQICRDWWSSRMSPSWLGWV